VRAAETNDFVTPPRLDGTWTNWRPTNTTNPWQCLRTLRFSGTRACEVHRHCGWNTGKRSVLDKGNTRAPTPLNGKAFVRLDGHSVVRKDLDRR